MTPLEASEIATPTGRASMTASRQAFFLQYLGVGGIQLFHSPLENCLHPLTFRDVPDSLFSVGSIQ
jgi:hypothetical protein